MPLLLLNGPPGVGKTKLADALVDLGAKRIVLNTPFTKFVRDALGLTDEEMKAGKDHILQERGFQAPIRSALIAAADAVEMVDPVVWVRNYFIREGMVLDGKDPLADAQRFAEAEEPGNHIYVLDALGKQEQYNWIDANVAMPSRIVRVVRGGTVDKDDYHKAGAMHTYAFTDGRHHCVSPEKPLIVANYGPPDELRASAQKLMDSFS